jgi:hypothetical protein
MSTFAWFTYRKILDPYFKMHINTWDIEYYVIENGEKNYFEDEDESGNKFQTPISVSFSEIYPGMEQQTQTVYIENNGEVDASIKSILKEFTVFETTYTIVDGEEDLDNENGNTAYLSYSEENKTYTIVEDAKSKLPITITITQPEAVNAKQTVTTNINVNWIFNGNDAVDSKWGHDVTLWNQDSSKGAPLNIKFNLDFTQILTTNTSGSEEGSGEGSSEGTAEEGSIENAGGSGTEATSEPSSGSGV